MGSTILFDADRMQAIEDGTVTSGLIDIYGHLILSHHDGSTVDAGVAKGEKGNKGDVGATGTSVVIAPGLIEAYAGSTPPAGWVFCDGSPLDRTVYASLYAVIGTTYGAGNGTTTFNVPDLRGKVITGFDASQTEFQNLAKTGGEKTHVLTELELPPYVSPNTVAGSTPSVVPSGATYGFHYTSVAAVGHNNLQPYNTLNYIISLGTSGSLGGGTIPSAQYSLRGSSAQRDALFGVPGTDAARVALANQALSWFNTDLGWEESYYATTGLSGLGVIGLQTGITSGWFPIGNGPEFTMQPSATYASTAGSYVGGWNGSVFRKGGSTWFDYTANYLKILKAGIYDLSWWTQQVNGTGIPDYWTRLLSNSGATVEWQSNSGGWVLNASTYSFAGGTFQSIFVSAGEWFCVLANAGTLTLHNVSASGTRNVRGEIRAKYIGPPLVSN